MTTVFIKKSTYAYEQLRPAIFEMLTAMDDGRVGRGTRVLVKPNLLLPAGPDKAVLTHPHVVRAAVEYALQKGARVRVGDSPALGPFDRIMELGGFARALEGLDVECRPFKATVRLDIGPPYGGIDVARAVVESDAVINLAKLKTHGQMLLTLGVKNMFGCIVGLMKPEWHLRAGIERDTFAHLLVQVYRSLAPAFTLVDGILAMEGQGPGKTGRPRPLGLLVGSRDAVAADRVICKILGLPPEELATHRAAVGLGLGGGTLRVIGDLPILRDFQFPHLGPLIYGPRPLHPFVRRHLLQKPVADTRLCGVCGKCWQYCPAKAITRDQTRIVFDYDKCIRCCCCQEVCPEGAIWIKEPWPGRLVRRIAGLK